MSTAHRNIVIQTREKYANLSFPFCPDVAVKYDKLHYIGEGTFGVVNKGRNKETRQFVALKKVGLDDHKDDRKDRKDDHKDDRKDRKDEGFPITSLKEIRALMSLKHENIVELIEVCRKGVRKGYKYRNTFYLVFEYCDYDLKTVLANTNLKLRCSDNKRILQQLLDGLFFIHNNRFIHRDIKPDNILITKNGIVKIADFGLARTYNIVNNARDTYTNNVVTLWYRPPELLLEANIYGPSVDIWSVGCIMAELWTRKPIMQGENEISQLKLICSLCGSITPEVWPGVVQLNGYRALKMEKQYRRQVKEKLSSLFKDDLALDLFEQLLTLDPKDRIESDMALNHDYFWSEPMPSNLKIFSEHGRPMVEKGNIMNAPVQPLFVDRRY